jgi:hypothetical protein
LASSRNTPPGTGRRTRNQGPPLDPTAEEDENDSQVSLHDQISVIQEQYNNLRADQTAQAAAAERQGALNEARFTQMMAAINAISNREQPAADPAEPATAAPAADPAAATQAVEELEERLEDRFRALELRNRNQNVPPIDPTEINIYRPRPVGGYSAAQMATITSNVRTFMPRARTTAQVDAESRPDINLKKQIRWTTEFYIQDAEDGTIHRRLQAIENELFESLIPYRAWPQRILVLLKNDFLAVRAYLEKNVATTWMETLQIIGTMLRAEGRLHEPWYRWIHMHPTYQEQQIGYAQRIRKAFYDLSETQQTEDPQVREHLLRLIRASFATIWGNIQYHQHLILTPELVDDLCRRTTSGERRAVEGAFFSHATVSQTLQGAHQPFPSVRMIPGGNAAEDKTVVEFLPTQEPQAAGLPSTFGEAKRGTPQLANLISDPRTDERTVSFAQGTPDDGSHALAVGDGNCHNCGKPGHWARDCRQPQQERRGGFRQARGNSNNYSGGSNNYNSNDRSRTGGDQITIKDATITGKLARTFQAARRPFQGSNNRGSRGRPAAGRGGSSRGGRRQYAITNGDYEVEAMEYGVTTDNPDMVNELLNDAEPWDQYEEEYDENGTEAY